MGVRFPPSLLTKRKYKKNIPYSRLSINLDNLIHLSSTSPKKSKILKIWKQGNNELFIAQPNWKFNSTEFTTAQHIKFFYNLSDSQFNFLVQKAYDFNIGIIPLIESRLDVLLFRLQFASSIFQAGDLISQNLVSINNKICNNKHLIVPIGSKISIDSTKIIINKFKFNCFNFNIPSYLSLISFNSAIFLFSPSKYSILLPLNLDILKFPAAF